MTLAFRLAVYVPVLFLIALVVVGQQQSSAAGTVHAAARRTVRWFVWTAVLVLVMVVLELLFIGW